MLSRKNLNFFQFKFSCFSISGFDNALSFKNVNDEHIKEVEQLIREYSIQSEVASKPDEVYGKFYAKIPKNLNFCPVKKFLLSNWLIMSKESLIKMEKTLA